MSNLFNKIIGGRQFNFQPLEFRDQAGYHVDVKDEENTRWKFRIVLTVGIWMIEGEKLPQWIRDSRLEEIKIL
ncbi:MAG: hypothetical protein ABI863_22350 [Ginsengibacter sp.]